MIVNRRSLSFNEMPSLKRDGSEMLDVNAAAFTAGTQAINTFVVISSTNLINNEYRTIVTHLTDIRVAYQQQVSEALAINPTDVSLRSKGVSLAWQYENAELRLGGKGTSAWTSGQRQEILETGTIRGGHHINNVADHPDMQANPDNIQFAKDRDEHLDA